MSANHVDQQRSKGQPNQVSNGGKDVMKVDDSYLQQPPQHQQVRSWSDQATDGGAYGAPPMSNAGVSDSFFQSYFTPNMSYPFMNQGIQGASEQGPWSNGADGMFGMGYDYSSVYGGFGFPYSNWQYTDDYWGQSSQHVRKDQRGYPSEDAYYPSPEQMNPPEPYGMMNGAPAAPQEAQEPIGTVEQGLRNMTIQPNVSSVDTRRNKMDMAQPPVNVMTDGYAGGDQSFNMPAPVSSHSVSNASMMGNNTGGNNHGSGGSMQPKKTSWAAIASKPAAAPQQMRPRTIPRAPVNPNKPHNMDIGTWDMRGNPNKAPAPMTQNSQQQMARQGFPPRQLAQRQMQAPSSSGSQSVAVATSVNANNSSNSAGNMGGPTNSYSNYAGGNSGSSWPVNNASSFTSNGEDLRSGPPPAPAASVPTPIVDKLKTSNAYNPKEFNLNPKSARFFVIKSYSEDDIHRSIKYSIWCSTDHGNKRLDQAFREREGKGPIYLIYSVNGSGHFCGVAQMMEPVDYNQSAGVWAQDKWKGKFKVKWVYVKDVPNQQLRHIRLENNENKPVTNSRDTQEVPIEKGKQVLRIIHSYKHMTSIFDDFHHYEKKQEEDQAAPPPSRDNRRDNRGENNRGDNRDRGDYNNRGGDRGDRGDRNHDRSDRGERNDRGGDRNHDRGGDRNDRSGGGDRGHDRGHDRGDRDSGRENRDGGMQRGGFGSGGRGRDTRRPQNQN